MREMLIFVILYSEGGNYMNINTIMKKDYLEKNTILMIVYGIATTLGGLAQLFQDRPIGLALALIIPSLFALLFYFTQRKVSKLQIAKMQKSVLPIIPLPD